MEKYVQIKSLREAKKDEIICASYPNPGKNVSGKKDEEQIINAAKDAKRGICKLLVWRKFGGKEARLYILERQDVDQIIARYENAKIVYKEYQQSGNPECRFEYGRAYALEGILEMLGFDYTDVRTGRFSEED